MKRSSTASLTDSLLAIRTRLEALIGMANVVADARLTTSAWGDDGPAAEVGGRDNALLSYGHRLDHGGSELRGKRQMGTEIRIGSLSDFPDGALVGVDVDGNKLIVARKGADVHVARNRCPHLGFSLISGPGGLRYENDVVQCPWHNSRFNVCTGENLDWVTGFAGRPVPKWSRPVIALGRKPRGLDMLSATVRDGDLYVTVA